MAAPKHKRNKSSVSNATSDAAAARAAKIEELKAYFRATVTTLGDESERWCYACYHPGHWDESHPACPVTRLKTYIFGEFRRYHVVGSQPDGVAAEDFFFEDFALAAEGHAWAITAMRMGYASPFGITIAHLGVTSRVLEQCKQLAKDGWIRRQPGIAYNDEELLVTSHRASWRDLPN
jgi:hypothetical protein